MTKEQNSERSSDSYEPNLGLSLQQVMELGQAAATLLGNPVYNAVHQMAVNEALEEWSQTSPKEVQKRESLWQEVQAHGRAAEKAASMVSRAEEALQKQNDTPEKREADFLNEQGFHSTQFQ